MSSLFSGWLSLPAFGRSARKSRKPRDRRFAMERLETRNVLATFASAGGAPVRLRDLGQVIDGSKEVRTLARLNGTPAVVLYVQRQSGTNTVE